MNFFDVIADLVILFIVGNWIMLGISLVKKKQCGEIVVESSKRDSRVNIAVGIVMAIASLANFSAHNNFSLTTKIMNWVVYPTCNIELIYFGITKTQFREAGIVYNISVTKYVDIETYQWEESNRLAISRKGSAKKIFLYVQEQKKEEIMKCLEEKVLNK